MTMPLPSYEASGNLCALHLSNDGVQFLDILRACGDARSRVVPCVEPRMKNYPDLHRENCFCKWFTILHWDSLKPNAKLVTRQAGGRRASSRYIPRITVDIVRYRSLLLRNNPLISYGISPSMMNGKKVFYKYPCCFAALKQANDFRNKHTSQPLCLSHSYDNV